jgi:hypothetical protein
MVIEHANGGLPRQPQESKKRLRYVFKVQIAREVRYRRKFVIKTSR